MDVDLRTTKQLWDEIDESRNGSMERERWEIAEQLWLANRSDKVSQVDISAAVGRHQTTIGKWIAVWDRSDEFEDVSFTDAIQIVKLSTSKAIDLHITRQTLTKLSPAEMDHLLRGLPTQTKKMIKAVVVK